MSVARHPTGTGTAAAAPSSEVLWHDLECGSYRPDLPLWRELAAQHPGPILDVGAGAGRVALELARAGHAVTALDRDPVLLEALRGRGAHMQVRTVCADARSFRLGERAFALCLVPMQTVQLLGGAAGRGAFLRRALAHLRPGGLLACAILSAVEPFDCAAGEIGPSAETALAGGLLYVSRPTRVLVGRRRIVIERERSILPGGTHAGALEAGVRRGGELELERDVIALERLSASRLQREAVAVGLRPEPAREVAPTEDHVGSTVVMLRA